MKNNLKILFLLFSLLLFISSCEKDLYDEVLQDERNIKISKISIKDPIVFNNRNLMSEIQKVKEKQSVDQANGKIVYDSINNFYFDDENGLLIETEDGYKSYTFAIYKDEQTEKLENVVFSQKNNEQYEAYIVKYNATEQEKQQIANEEYVQFTDEDLEIESLNDPIAITGKCDYWAVDRIKPHPDGGCIIEWVYVPCSGGGSGSGGGTGGTGGGTSGSGTGGYEGPSGGVGSSGTGSSGEGSYGSDPILTSPVGGYTGGSSGLLVSPCKKTKNQLDKYATLKPALVTLAGTTSASQENGIYIYDTATSTTANPVQNLPSTTIAGVTAVGLPNPTAPNKYTVIAHTHDASGPLGTGSYSIFSWQDLTRLAELIHDGHMDNDNFVFYLATADGTRYALTTELPTAFADYFDRRKTYGIPESQTNLDYKKAVELGKSEKDYYSNAPLANKIHLVSDKNDDLKTFLKMQKELKIDFTLFEVDPTFTTYTKVSLKSDGTIKRETCN